MSLQAYQSATTRSENPRATEYRLFAQVTRALMGARDNAEDMKARIDALDWIISLSLFVSKHSSAVVRSGADIDTLIEINRMIMQGLEAQASLKPEPVAANG